MGLLPYPVGVHVPDPRTHFARLGHGRSGHGRVRSGRSAHPREALLRLSWPGPGNSQGEAEREARPGQLREVFDRVRPVCRDELPATSAVTRAAGGGGGPPCDLTMSLGPHRDPGGGEVTLGSGSGAVHRQRQGQPIPGQADPQVEIEDESHASASRDAEITVSPGSLRFPRKPNRGPCPSGSTDARWSRQRP